jgi:succinyl-diaminopimelate desuccinylase
VGAADMKGGLAVFLHLATGLPDPAVDVTWCFYVCEEVDQRFNGLRSLWQERPDLLRGDAAVLGEPTGGVVEAGCQGMLRLRIELAGARAHTARPSEGRNAVHRLAPLLTAIADYRSRVVVLDGCEYAEQVQVVDVSGGVATNVVPDRASVLVNHRFAPDRTPTEAEEALRELLAPALEAGDHWEVVDSAPAAPPALDHALLARLVEATDAAPRAKQGWTDVASFWAHGIPAANFGPGDPLLAHTAGEHVSIREIERAVSVFEALLRRPDGT